MQEKLADRTRTALAGLRVAVAILLIIHGVARSAYGIVGDFGGFLDAMGIPIGLWVAWFITGMEIVGGVLMALGWWTRPFALYFTAQLLTGVVLVHAQEGWFVVGAGRNGVEYSVLLMAVLLAVAYAAPPMPAVQRGRRSRHLKPDTPSVDT